MKRFVALLIFLLLPYSADAANRYVRTDGLNTSSCGLTDDTAACATLSYMVNTSSHKPVSGDTVYVRAGTYTDNSQVVLGRGISISGAGSATTIINTTGTYISARTSVPVADGSNEIFGIKFIGGGILSTGRSNQKIHDCVFQSSSVSIYGKYGYDDSGGGFSKATCTGGDAAGSSCENDFTLSVPPSSNDWAVNCQIHNNTITGGKIFPGALKQSRIHHNTITNSGSSTIGNTAYWINEVEIDHNNLTAGSATLSIIGIEIWHISNWCKFHDNTSDSWFSLGVNTRGNDPGYDWSYESYNNIIVGSNGGGIVEAMEVMTLINDIWIHNNYFSGAAFARGIAIWTGYCPNGAGVISNIRIDHNVFYNLPAFGVYIMPSCSADNFHDINIYNNVFDTMATAIDLDIKGHGVASNLNIKNNIMLNLTTRGVGISDSVGGGTVTSNINVDYNFYHNVSTWLWQSPTGQITDGGHNNNVSPGVTGSGNRPDPYYRPSSAGSNLVNAGIIVGLPYSGSAPDIGAFEFASIPPAPPANLRNGK